MSYSLRCPKGCASFVTGLEDLSALGMVMCSVCGEKLVECSSAGDEIIERMLQIVKGDASLDSMRVEVVGRATVVHSKPSDGFSPEQIVAWGTPEFFDGPFGPGGWEKDVGDLVTLRGRLGDVLARIMLRNKPYWLGEIVTVFNLFAGASAEHSNYKVGQKIWFGDLHVIGVVRVPKPGAPR